MPVQWFIVPVIGFNSSFPKTCTWGGVDIADSWLNANNMLSVAGHMPGSPHPFCSPPDEGNAVLTPGNGHRNSCYLLTSSGSSLWDRMQRTVALGAFGTYEHCFLCEKTFLG